MKKYKIKSINLTQIEMFEELNQKKINEIEVKKPLIYVPWQISGCNGFYYEDQYKKLQHVNTKTKSNNSV
jgi:hypothetical protein